MSKQSKVKLSKYDKTLKREVVVETSIPAEANQLRHQGFKEVKPEPDQALGRTQQPDNKTKNK